MADDSELSRLDPETCPVTLSGGLEVEVVRMRTRQFFRLLKILTHGAGPQVMQAGLDFGDSPEDFTRKLLVLVVMSIPDAETEAIAFLQSMCQPSGLSGKAKPNKQQGEKDQDLWGKFNQAMFNPELEDLVDLMETIVRQEAPELQALGKKLIALLKVAGVTKDTQAEEPASQQDLANSSPGGSRSRSTSSATSTGGQTSTSTTSRSAGSASASRRSRAAATASS
jgi:hypothetical protein